MPDFVDWEIEPEQQALILGLVRGERRDYAESATRLGLIQSELVEGVVQYLLSSAYGGDLSQVLVDLGIHPQEVLQAAFTMLGRDEVALMRERAPIVFAPYAEWIEWRLAGGRDVSRHLETRAMFITFDQEPGSAANPPPSSMSRHRDSAPIRLPFRKASNRYVIRKMIWAGGQGAVYRADDLRRGRPVAVKIERKQRRESESVQRLLLAEAEILHELDHPGILPILDSGVQDEHAFLVVKLCEGDLGQAIDRKPPTHAEASQVVFDLAHTLGFVHDRGLIHRDIKPGNVLIDGGSVLLADFGLAIRMPEAQPRGVVGTPPYMSPEQCRTEPIDQRTDIYSLGIVLYQLLTGQLPFSTAKHYQLDEQITGPIGRVMIPENLRPFRATGLEELFHLIREKPPLPPQAINPSIPATLEDICLKALAKDPADRFQTAGEMASKIRRWQLTSPRWIATRVWSRFRSMFHFGDQEVRQTIESLHQSLDISVGAGSRVDEGLALASLGLVYASIGDERRAVSFQEQALSIFRSEGDQSNIADTSWNMSRSLYKLGESEQAVQHAEIALKIYESISDGVSAAEVRACLEKWKAAG